MCRQSGYRSFAIAGAVLLALCLQPISAQTIANQSSPSLAAQVALLDKYCVTCHSDKLRTGGLSLQSANLNDVPKNAETWEKVIRKLHVGAMPQQGLPRPDKPALDNL